MKNYALQTLTIEDAIFQSKNVAFVLEMADKLERLKVNSVKTAGMLFEAKWNLLDYIKAVKERTPLLRAKDESVEQEMDKQEQDEVDEVMIERQMDKIMDDEQKHGEERVKQNEEDLSH